MLNLIIWNWFRRARCRHRCLNAGGLRYGAAVMPDPAGTASRDAMAPSWVYVLCLDPPRGLGEADVPRAAAISHYVGWTQQDWPMKRAGSHAGAGMGTCVLLIPEPWLTRRN
jgi:hypothetical protein